MDENSYESPRDVEPTRQPNVPLVVLLSAAVAGWLFFGGLMFFQYHDEAAGYMPRWTMRPSGYAIVAGGIVVCGFYLWRAIRGTDPFSPA